MVRFGWSGCQWIAKCERSIRDAKRIMVRGEGGPLPLCQWSFLSFKTKGREGGLGSSLNLTNGHKQINQNEFNRSLKNNNLSINKWKEMRVLDFGDRLLYEWVCVCFLHIRMLGSVRCSRNVGIPWPGAGIPEPKAPSSTRKFVSEKRGRLEFLQPKQTKSPYLAMRCF